MGMREAPGSVAARPYRHLYLMLAWCCLLLALLGAVLPLLPVTPFLLGSLWLSTRAESGLAQWLLNHRRFGPPIRQWQQERSLSRATKRLVIAMLAVNWVGLLLIGVEPVVLVLTAFLFSGVVLFICRIRTASANRAAPAVERSGEQSMEAE